MIEICTNIQMYLLEVENKCPNFTKKFFGFWNINNEIGEFYIIEKIH